MNIETLTDMYCLVLKDGTTIYASSLEGKNPIMGNFYMKSGGKEFIKNGHFNKYELRQKIFLKNEIAFIYKSSVWNANSAQQITSKNTGKKYYVSNIQKVKTGAYMADLVMLQDNPLTESDLKNNAIDLYWLDKRAISFKDSDFFMGPVFNLILFMNDDSKRSLKQRMMKYRK